MELEGSFMLTRTRISHPLSGKVIWGRRIKLNCRLKAGYMFASISGNWKPVPEEILGKKIKDEGTVVVKPYVKGVRVVRNPYQYKTKEATA